MGAKPPWNFIPGVQCPHASYTTEHNSIYSGHVLIAAHLSLAFHRKMYHLQ